MPLLSLHIWITYKGIQQVMLWGAVCVCTHATKANFLKYVEHE